MYAEGELLTVELNAEGARAQTLHGHLRVLKALAALWAGVGLAVGAFGTRYGGSSDFPLLGSTAPDVFALGMFLVPLAGLYVAIAGSRVGGGEKTARFRRGALRSLVLVDWIPLVLGAAFFSRNGYPNPTGLVVGIGVLLVAAWSAAYMMEKAGVGSVSRGLLVGAAVGEIPAIGLGFFWWVTGSSLWFVLWGTALGGPAAVQMLLLADFGLIRLDLPTNNHGDHGEDANSAFEVVPRSSVAGGEDDS